MRVNISLSMADSNRFWIRMLLAMLFPFILAGGAQVVLGVVTKLPDIWVPASQIAVFAAVFGFLLVAWRERGFLYVLISIILISVVGGILGKFLGSIILQMLFILAIQIIGLAFLIPTDMLGRPRLLLRALFSAAGGFAAGLLISGIIGSVNAGGAGFAAGIEAGIPYVLEVSLSVAAGVLLTRIIAGEKTSKQPVKELE